MSRRRPPTKGQPPLPSQPGPQASQPAPPAQASAADPAQNAAPTPSVPVKLGPELTAGEQLAGGSPQTLPAQAAPATPPEAALKPAAAALPTGASHTPPAGPGSDVPPALPGPAVSAQMTRGAAAQREAASNDHLYAASTLASALPLLSWYESAAAEAATPRALKALANGLAVALAAHVTIGLTVWLAPTGVSEEVEAAIAANVEPIGDCTSVVSPACLGEKSGRSEPIAASRQAKAPGPRRCPEPMRRLLRREVEPPPPALVDLLEAELVERLGDPTGKALPLAPASGPKTAAEAAQQRISAVDKLVRADNKLDAILKGGDEGDARRSELGKILGTKTGQVGGDGLINRKGSAYVREVRIAMQRSFVLPGNVPPWLRAELRAKVRITRMTASGQVLEYAIDKKSGNEAFDDTVQALMAGYKSGLRSLPPPPPHVLEEILSRGLVVDLRGG